MPQHNEEQYYKNLSDCARGTLEKYHAGVINSPVIQVCLMGEQPEAEKALRRARAAWPGVSFEVTRHPSLREISRLSCVDEPEAENKRLREEVEGLRRRIDEIKAEKKRLSEEVEGLRRRIDGTQ